MIIDCWYWLTTVDGLQLLMQVDGQDTSASVLLDGFAMIQQGEYLGNLWSTATDGVPGTKAGWTGGEIKARGNTWAASKTKHGRLWNRQRGLISTDLQVYWTSLQRFLNMIMVGLGFTRCQYSVAIKSTRDQTGSLYQHCRDYHGGQARSAGDWFQR